LRHHTNCADWGYDTHPNRPHVTRRCEILTSLFCAAPDRFDKFHFDTRRGHAYLFQGMTPAECSCILGRYRGDPSCPQLAVDVGAGKDPQVGIPFAFVDQQMKVFEARCVALVRVHEKWLKEKGHLQAPRNALLKFVEVLAAILELFLTIHPYMDGNGHCARMLVYLMMVRAGYPPKSWAIDAKQPYDDALSAHRRGKRGALQAFLLNAINGAPAAPPAPVVAGQTQASQ
jgi:hypothetical protein